MENLCAAIPIVDSSNTLSEQEFQKMLSSWLEEKGVLGDLRSQLRFKMIHALKDTAIGRDINKKPFHQMSLSKQAVNIIIAEYLMQNKCYYSLSIFNTEASLTHILPDYSIHFNNTNIINQVYLDKESILNMLELIGIVRTSPYCQELFTLYFNEQENCSLLSCIISLLCKLVDKNDGRSHIDMDVDFADINAENNFMKQIGNLLNLLGLSGDKLKTALENIKTLYEIEKKCIEEEYSQLINELRVEIESQEKQIIDMFKTNKILKRQLLKINKDYKKLKLDMKNLMLNEELLKQNLEKKNKQNKETNSVSSGLAETEKQESEVCKLQRCSDICEENKRVNGMLIEQNRNLKEENEQKKAEIMKLTLKCNQLINEFVNCQNKICLLNSKINDGNTDLSNNVLYGDHGFPVNLEKNIDLSDISSDNNLTEEILHEARIKLKQLEEETRTIDEKCKYLHLRNVV